jgi:hypothetical protein
MGSFPAHGTRSREEFQGWLDEMVEGMKRLEDAGKKPAPWAVNLVVHASNPRYQGDLELVEKYKVPVILTSKGAPGDAIKRIHGWGAVALHDIANRRHAEKALEAGVDGVSRPRGPKAGEVLVEIKATGICHTDEFTLSGATPRAAVPGDLRPRGRRRRATRSARGVTGQRAQASLKPWRPRHPALHARVPRCKSCLSRKTNLCTSIRATQGKGVMPDGTRFSIKGKKIHHYMGCSTFSNYTVLPEIALAKIREDAPFDKVCYIGCGVTTGIGAVINTAKVEPAPTSWCSASAASAST